MKRFLGLFIVGFCSVLCACGSRPESRVPVIGISDFCNGGTVTVSRTYFDAVLRAGGVPVLIPLIGDEQKLDGLLQSIDGLILTGGGDVDPAYFGEEPSPHLGHVNAPRDTFDFRLIELAARHKIPVLGICRGIQMINVAFGGTLYQDLPSEYADTSVCHMQAVPGYVPTHTVRVEKGSFVAVATGMDTLRTNSFHHQAVKRVADGVRVAATATDGVVEAIEDPDRGVFGTQFHPEDHTVAGDTVMVKFFEFLVREAGKKAR